MTALPEAFRRRFRERMAPPPSDPLIEQARRWADEDDPEKTVTELFGIRVYSDMRRGLQALHDSPRVVTWGGHSLAKTFGVGLGLLGHYWYAGGSVHAEDGKPRGALLVLMAGKDDQIKRTSWETIRKGRVLAARNGHPMRGAVLPVDVGWRKDADDPLRWAIISQPFRAPSKAAAARAIQTEAGLKHDHAIHVWIEEFDTVPGAMLETVRGWSEPGKIFGAFNPAHQGAAIQGVLKSREWVAVNFSTLRWEPLLERRPIPGGASHEVFEAEMRDPIRVQPLDIERLRKDGKEPNPDLGHFQYALPESEWPEKPGPREDGIPGHPDAIPSWWKAGEMFIWQRLGIFPLASDKLIFSPYFLARAAELWESLAEPTWKPRIVAVDTAEGGPDRFVLAGQFGRDAADIWRRYQAALVPKSHPPQLTGQIERSEPMSPERALALAVRCPGCEGIGCETCWDGFSPWYLGRPHVLAKHKDGEIMADRIIEVYGTEPRYALDIGGGGYYLQAPLERRGCTVEGVQFGGGAAEQYEGMRPGKFRNERARMHGCLSAIAQLQVAALPPSVLGPLEMELHETLGLPEWESVTLHGETLWKLPDKADLLVSGSPDVSDCAVLTGGRGKRIVSAILR